MMLCQSLLIILFIFFSCLAFNQFSITFSGSITIRCTNYVIDPKFLTNNVYQEDEGIAFRGLFIIDGEQNVRQITVNDLPVGRDVDETIRLVQAFQFTDKHGEVCPAGWRPGKKTMKPNQEGVSNYLATNATSSNGN